MKIYALRPLSWGFFIYGQLNKYMKWARRLTIFQTGLNLTNFSFCSSFQGSDPWNICWQIDKEICNLKFCVDYKSCNRISTF